MGNPEYVKLILFHLESKLLFSYLGAPEMGTQAQFILLMEIIKQYDYLGKKTTTGFINSRELFSLSHQNCDCLEKKILSSSFGNAFRD